MAHVSVDARRPFRHGVGWGYVGGFFAGGLALSGVYATTGLGADVSVPGADRMDCPLCGGTRMGAALLHGDVAAAFLANPLALIGVIALGLLGAVWAIEVAGGAALRAPRSVSDRLRRVPRITWILVAVVLTVGYTLARNLV